MRVLLIEDDAQVRQMLVDAIETFRQGWEVALASNLHDGIDILGSLPRDAVLLDLSLNGLDRRAVARKVRKAAPDAAILVYTGTDPNDVIGPDAADDLLLKPQPVLRVLTTLELLVARRAAAARQKALDAHVVVVRPDPQAKWWRRAGALLRALLGLRR